MNNQKVLRDLKTQKSKNIQMMAEFAALDSMSDEQRSAFDSAESGIADLERRIRAAEIACAADDVQVETSESVPLVGDQKVLQLRSECRSANYLKAALNKKLVTGAEAEYQKECEVGDFGIPIDLFETEQRAITPAGNTVGVNMQPIQPLIFAQSMAMQHLNVSSPSVPSGTFAQATITTSVTASGQAKGATAPATAGAITVSTTTPHRVQGTVEFAIEDILAVGTDNFESVFRQNLSLALSAELDRLLLEGDNATTGEVSGFLDLITAPSATTPASGTVSFADGVDMFFSQVDGVFASNVQNVKLLTGVEAYRQLASDFRADEDSMTFSDWVMKNSGGLHTTPRLDDSDELSNKGSPGIFYKSGGNGMPMPMLTAVCPNWGSVSIDDIYSGAGEGQRSFTMSVYIGDLIIVQPSAYGRVSIRTVT